MINTLKDSTKLETSNVNSPELDSSGKVTRKSITSPEQAYAIAAQLEKNNQARNKVDAVILKKYNGGQPYDQSQLIANLEDWRSNASTGFLSGIVDRITPAPIQAVDAARHLSGASLGTGNPEDEKKSEFFRVELTKLIKGWDGWRDFLAALWQEDVLMGRAAPANLDPYSPWPKMFSGDAIFFPEGTGQHAKQVPGVAVKEDLLVQDFCTHLEDGPEISREAGWEFENCIKVLNEALPASQTSNSNGDNARKWEDAIREGNFGASNSGAKVVQLYHTLAVEPDSKRVTHYIVNRQGNHELLFSKEERFESMEDVVTLFTLSPGNGKYYGVRGVGKLLINAHISIEASRNAMLDNLRVGGMKILKVPANTSPSLQFKVNHPFMVVSGDGDFEERGITANVSDFIEADNQVAKWAEQIVGSYLPGLRGDDGSSTITATEATIIANRDAQAKTAFLARGLGQLANVISQIARRAVDPETTDKRCKEFQKKCLDAEQGNITKDELKQLSEAPAEAVAQDLTQMQNEQIVRIFPALVDKPGIDQDKLYERFLAAAVNPSFAKDVQLTKQGLQANEAEAMRQQQLETEAVLAGAPGIPVSPRDMHDVHLKTAFSDLKGAMPKVVQSAHQNPAVLDHLGAQLKHTGAHIGMMKDAGVPPQEIEPFEKAQKAFETVLEHVGQSLADQKAQNQAVPDGIGQASARPDAPPATMTPPDNQNAPDQPTVPPGGTLPWTEKLAVSWIGQYENLNPAQRELLEKVTGLGVAPEAAAPPAPVATPVAPPPAAIPVETPTA